MGCFRYRAHGKAPTQRLVKTKRQGRLVVKLGPLTHTPLIDELGESSFLPFIPEKENKVANLV